VLKQIEAGPMAENVAREQRVSKHTSYAWKAKYRDMEVSEAEEFKHLRDENSRLKKPVYRELGLGVKRTRNSSTAASPMYQSRVLRTTRRYTPTTGPTWPKA
jgi:putative transposase